MAVDDEGTDAFARLLAAAPELVRSPGYVTTWRTRGAYGTPTEGRTAQEIATPPFARAIGLIACDVAPTLLARWNAGSAAIKTQPTFAAGRCESARA